MKKGLKSGVFAAVLLSAASSQVYALDCTGTAGGTCATGTSSHGSFDITYTKGSNARIWGLADVALADTHLAGAPATQSICVYSNKDGTSNAYGLEIVSAHGFTLNDTSGAGATPLSYHIKVVDTGTGSVDDSTASGNTVTGSLNAGALTSQPDPTGACTTNKNATISVWFDTAPNAASGVYSDTVTLTVTPT